jgi:hypothetical protein
MDYKNKHQKSKLEAWTLGFQLSGSQFAQW